MIDPFRFCEDRGVVSFSGGRTSGYLLRRVLDAFGGELPEGVRVIFCNTSKEATETLDFVEECSARWQVPMTWLEWRPGNSFEVVDFKTAARKGEVFDAFMSEKIKRRDGTIGVRPLPNPVGRSCTTNLKFRTKHRYVRKVLDWKTYTSAVGIRADEASRAHGKFSEPGETLAHPLLGGGVTKADVLRFWAAQPFNLGLPTDIHGDTPRGNCDGCFMKSAGKVAKIAQTHPEALEWWAQMEERQALTDRPTTFRQDRPTYRQMIDAVKRGEPFQFGIFDDLTGCASHGCTD